MQWLAEELRSTVRVLKRRLLESIIVRNVLDYFHLDHIYQDVDQQATTDIPKKIHYVWLGSAVRADHQANIASWKKHNPDYEQHLWIDSATFAFEISSDDLQSIKSYCASADVILHDVAELPEFKDCVRKSFYHDWVNGDHKNYAFASDYLRIWILYLFGGLYSDLDIVCKKSIGLMQSESGFIGMTDTAHGELITDIWFMAATKFNKTVKKCITEMELHYQAFMLNGHTYTEFLQRFDVHLPESLVHIARINDTEQERELMRVAYNTFRFKTTANQFKRASCVGSLVLRKQLNEILRREYRAYFKQNLFFVDGILEDQENHSWHAYDCPPDGVRGVDIEGKDTRVIFDKDEKSTAVSREALEAKRDALAADGKEYGHLESLLAISRLGRARNAGIKLF